MKTLMMGTVAAIFAAGTAFAEDVTVVIDTDADGVVSVDEYRAALAEPHDDFWFDAWDADRDGVLTRDEISESWFAQYDADRDELLSQEEVKAWNSDNMRLNAMRAGREIEPPQ